MVLDEAVDGDLKVDDRARSAPPALRAFDEEALDSVQLHAGGRREKVKLGCRSTRRGTVGCWSVALLSTMMRLTTQLAMPRSLMSSRSIGLRSSWRWHGRRWRTMTSVSALLMGRFASPRGRAVTKRKESYPSPAGPWRRPPRSVRRATRLNAAEPAQEDGQAMISESDATKRRRGSLRWRVFGNPK